VVTKLTAKERDLLRRVEANPDLRPLFFRRVTGLKWFDALEERGYFRPENNPIPVPAKEEGYVTVPFWPILDYLVKISPELLQPENYSYARKILMIMIEATNYAKTNEYNNYHTWWRFAEIISHIPPEVVALEYMDAVDYWLDDQFGRGHIAEEVGKNWLSDLLRRADEHALSLARRLLESLYTVRFEDRRISVRAKQDAILRFEYHHAQKFTATVAQLAGQHLGGNAVSIFRSKIEFILDRLDNDRLSYMWQPAITPHEQNRHHENAENVLIDGLRESLDSYLSHNGEMAREYVLGMFDSEYQTIQRVAIQALDAHFYLFSRDIASLLDVKYFGSNYRYEMWHFLNRHYNDFDEMEKKAIVNVIERLSREEETGEMHHGATAYIRSVWFSAIKDGGETEAEAFRKYCREAGAEPENPDFASYIGVGWSGWETPISIEDLRALSVDALVAELREYEGPEGHWEPGVEGLTRALKNVVKSDPITYYIDLNKFLDLDVAYVFEIIEAYRELWAEKASLPWDDLWYQLFEFIDALISRACFWDSGVAEQRGLFVANPHWVVRSVARLIESGTKSDDHAFNVAYLETAETILGKLLEREKGDDFEVGGDAVSVAINSPRGQCIEALINVALRSCRTADKENDNDDGSRHLETWKRFKGYFEAELERRNAPEPEYEFATLVTNYLPNFLYMSKDWVLNNLDRIFDQANYLGWLCAMHGYAYVGTVYHDVYGYLKKHGDFVKVLDDKYLPEEVEHKVIQNIAVAYLAGHESLSEKDSLVMAILGRADEAEIGHLIWFIWTLRKDGDPTLRKNVEALWPNLLGVIDVSTASGRRLASQLCHWAVFVTEIDDMRREWLLTIAPYADEAHNSYDLLKNLAEISDTQPFEAHVIWMRMLEKTVPDYPEDAIRKLFKNLLREGSEGLRKAREVESEYLKKGNDRPSHWLKEIREETGGGTKAPKARGDE